MITYSSGYMLSTQQSAHITRMASGVIYKNMVVMVTIFWIYLMFHSYKGDNVYKMQKFHDLTIHTATCNISRRRSEDPRSYVRFS